MATILRRLSQPAADKSRRRGRQSSSDGESQTPVAKKFLLSTHRKQSEKMASGGVKQKNNPSAQQTSQGSDTVPPGPQQEPLDTLSKILFEIQKVHHSITEIRDEQSKLRESVEEKLLVIDNKMTTKLTELRSHIDGEMGEVNRRVDNIQSQVTGVEEMCKNTAKESDKEFAPIRTIVIKNLKEDSNQNTNSLVRDFVTQQLEVPNNHIVRVKRLISKGNYPGIVKVELSSEEWKINALRKKSKLRHVQQYEKVYIRTSLDHNELQSLQNWQTLIREVPGARNKLRLTGNGKLVLRDLTEGTQRTNYQSTSTADNQNLLTNQTLSHAGDHTYNAPSSAIYKPGNIAYQGNQVMNTPVSGPAYPTPPSASVHQTEMQLIQQGNPILSPFNIQKTTYQSYNPFETLQNVPEYVDEVTTETISNPSAST